MGDISKADLINKIRKMKAKDVNYSELICAKFVVVRQSRTCRCCGKDIPQGSECLTASHLEDKKYNVSYREHVKSGETNSMYHFVEVRHWMCNECALKRANEYHGKPKNKPYTNFNMLDLESYSMSEKFNILKYALIHGDATLDEVDEANLSDELLLDLYDVAHELNMITDTEYEEVKNDIIESMAYTEAVGIGQE